jgi:steroid 5-alpha reductase family enzyme
VTTKPSSRGSQILVALAVFMVSLLCVAGLCFAIFTTIDRKPGSFSFVDVLWAPSVVALGVTAGVAVGIGLRWRSSPLLLGLIAALPYFALSGAILAESRTDGVGLWTIAGLVAFVLNAGAVHYLRRT